MSVGEAFAYPEAQQRQRRGARRLSWLTIAALVSTASAMWLTLGQSQAMKTAWAEDLLGMIPPAPALVAAPSWRLAALGRVSSGVGLRQDRHVWATAPGENAGMVRVERFLDARRGAIPALLRRGRP